MEVDQIELSVVAGRSIGDPGRLQHELQAERLAGMTIFATALRTRGHLRAGISVHDARDTLWTDNSAEIYQLLVDERGWTPQRYGRWVGAALTAALLRQRAPASPPPKKAVT